MQFAQKFIHSFFPNYSQVNISENDKEFYCELSATNFLPSDIISIQAAFDFLQPNDLLTFTISFGEADSISFYSQTNDLADFKLRLEEEFLHQEGEPIIATLVIIKTKVTNNISIYDLNTFIETLEKLSVAEAFVIFNRVLLTQSFVKFNVLNLDKSFHTTTIFFTPAGNNSSLEVFTSRRKRLDSIRTVSYYSNIEEHNLIPDDFKLKIENTEDNKLNLLFNRYCAILSIIYLFDITTLKENELEFKINGYKSISGKVNVKTQQISGTEEYFNIYDWVYSGGNLIDKIGLARNIISLHFFISGELALKGNPYQSIQSSYKVYEKQNIKQYIEIRNKISDQLLDFNNRANKVIETFASGFQKSALALISFYISAIVLKVLGKGEFLNVFTLDATLLSIAFIIGSFIYYHVSRWEVKQQRQRFIDSYNNLKDRYTDLLDKNDIERILNNDKEFNADVGFINDKLRNYSSMWVGFLLILFLVTLILFCTYNISELFDSLIWKLLFKKSCSS